MNAVNNRQTRSARAAGFLLLIFVIFGALPMPAIAAPADAPPAAELPLGCYETIANGGFEQLNVAWVIPPSLYPGVYDNTLAFEGAFSMLLGRINGPIYAADSTVEQTVNLPSTSTSIILNFRYYGRIEGTAGTPDRQYLDLYDANTGSFIRRQFEARNNDRLWLGAQYNLTDLRGRTVRFVFGTNNDGVDGRIAMNIDQVSVYYCSPQPTATNTPLATATFTPWPTAFPTQWPTPLPTWMPSATPLPGGCQDIIVNGGFEGTGGWDFGKTPIQGGYVAAPVFQGQRAAQLGNPPGFCPDQVAFSSTRQLVTIPADATWAELRYHAQYGTQEQPSNSIPAGADRQELILLNPDLSTLAVLSRQRTNSGGYVQQSADLSQYRGRQVYIYFNALNDGNNLTTWMYLDNVMLCVGSAAPPQPQPFIVPGTPAAVATWPAATTAPPPGYNTPAPTFFVPTITPTPTWTPNPAPLSMDASAPPAQAAATTSDAAPVAQLQQFAQTLMDGTPDPTLQAIADAAPAQSTQTRSTAFNALTGMCGVVIVAVLLFGGILYVISRPKSPPSGGPPTNTV